MDSTTASFIKRSDSVSPSASPSFQARLFLGLLGRMREGRLNIIFPNGACATVGDADAVPEQIIIRDNAFFGRVLAGGSVGLGESYVEGLWETPNLAAVLRILGQNQEYLGRAPRGFSLIGRWVNRFIHLGRRNTLKNSRSNIQQHYDLSNEFYQCFLDPSMTYSSALFSDYYETLENAQMVKIDRMLDLAGVKAGDHVLEIGSGWGALAIRAAQRGAKVKTITLSDEQYALARERIQEANLCDHIEIVLQDYRDLEGQYDAVLSCEMIEAVGQSFLPSYFKTIRNSLKPGSRAVIQAITIPDERYAAYCRSCDWIQKHIFPGGHLPSPGAIHQCVDQAGGMAVESMQGFGKDYAETLQRWRRNFNTSRQRVETLGFDDPFCRKWNYYLAYCEAGFDAGLIDVQHVVLQRH
ncbi:MAG: class I SAM-dependent methyltransferase [Coraliomargaritaceae bacterium]